MILRPGKRKIRTKLNRNYMVKIFLDKLALLSKRTLVITLIAILVAAAAFNSVDAALSNKEQCESGLGTWTGDAGSLTNGTCYYPAGTIFAGLFCVSGSSYTLTVAGGVLIVPGVCHGAAVGHLTLEAKKAKCDSRDDTWYWDGDIPACVEVFEVMGRIRAQSITDKEVRDGNASLWLNNGSAGANFSIGVCLQQCTVNNQLPKQAKNNLPSKGVLATLYVRVVDENGEPGNGVYRACFANPDGNKVVIFQFISGTWIPVMYGSAATFCTSGAGDGSYYLAAG
jgi:hypothetical protein